MKRQIKFYKTLAGECPVINFLDSLPSKVAQKITWVMKLVEDLDIIPAQYFKKLSGTNDLWECRIKLGSNIYRILGFMHKNNFVILTQGFVKKTDKIPSNEIEKSHSYKNEFLRQEGEKL